MIYDYKPIFYPAARSINSPDKKKDRILEYGLLVRVFFIEGQRLFLFINADTLDTAIVPVEEIYFRDPALAMHKGLLSSLHGENGKNGKSENHYFTWEAFRKSNYVETIYRFTETPSTQKANGLSHALKDVKGYFLTVDMCPSVRPTEQEFFQALVDLSAKRTTPFPVAISISGAWLEAHKDDFAWFIDQQSKGLLDITWVNHSYSHFYLNDLVNQENFLLNPFVDTDLEMLETEKDLIINKQTPSLFFRYPGLISNSNSLAQARKYGFIPLGADAWLAKGQKPKDGSIILVHGNGNEHQGIIDIMPILKSHDPEGWLPISKTIV